MMSSLPSASESKDVLALIPLWRNLPAPRRTITITRTFSYFGPKSVKAPLIPSREFSTHNNSFLISLIKSGNRNSLFCEFCSHAFMPCDSPNPDVGRSLTFFSSLSEFPLSEYRYLRCQQIETQFSESRYVDFLRHVWTQLFHLFILSIGTSELAGSRVLTLMNSGLTFPRTPIQRHLYSTNPRGPTIPRHLGISRIANPTCECSLLSRTPILRTPIPRDPSTRVPKINGYDFVEISRIAMSPLLLHHFGTPTRDMPKCDSTCRPDGPDEPRSTTLLPSRTLNL
jgi:hypothetical protein